MSDDTAAIQAAHDYAYSVGGAVYFPPGQYLTNTFNWKYVSLIGAGSPAYPATVGTVLIGKPGKDILHVDTTVNGIAVPAWNIENITFKVDDSVDASASFPQRGGVGNAGFAVDKPDGSDAANKTFLNQGTFKNVSFISTSMAETGQNNSAGLYKQSGSSAISWVGYNSFFRLKYGYWEHYPTSNLTSLELASDHTNTDTLFFDGCDSAIRLVNNAASNFDNIVIHGQGTNGFQGIGATSLTRNNCQSLVFGNVEIESATSNWTTGWNLTGTNHVVNRLAVYTQTGDVTIASSYSTYGRIGYSCGTNQISITGDKNRILGLARVDSPATEPTISNSGLGNTIVVDTVASGQHGQLRFYDSANGMMVFGPNKIGNDSLSGSLSIGSQKGAGTGDVYLDAPNGGNIYLRMTGQSPAVQVDQFSRVAFGNRTPGNGGVLFNSGIALLVATITYSASMTPNMNLGTMQKINATNGTAFTINDPIGQASGNLLVLDIKNSSGGAMGAVTWGASFLLAGAFTNPANGKRRTITFYYDGTNWVQLGPTSADI